MLIAAALMLALSAIYLLIRKHSPHPSQLQEARPTVVILGVQIICGDCAGEDGPALKTYLNRSGNCARCGGQSYMPAANCASPSSCRAEHGLRSYQRALKDVYI